VNGYRNNLGKVVTWEYRSSAQFHLDDRRAGRAWVTTLPFPVQCVSKVSLTDEVTRTYLTSESRYHHGHYDAVDYAATEECRSRFLRRWFGEEDPPRCGRCDRCLSLAHATRVRETPIATHSA
jgi:superfamily II DNA helicase RecQ